ncbi:MAG: glycosyltransferase family 2 protein [Egibacteraceae bacterium]
MPSTPLVSVGVPVYNGELFLARALDSLLTQDMEDFEIVIADNASTDSTEQISRDYADRDARIRYHRNPRNLGLAKNFNLTFKLSTGKYFKWATHDDWHSSESLRLCVERLEACPSAGLCATGVAVVDEVGTQVGEWIPSVDLTTTPRMRMRMLLRTLGETHPMYGLLRASVLARTALMRSYVGSDRTLLAHLSLLAPMVHTPAVLHYYTVSATARQNYRPSLTYDPANAGRLPLRTWRLIGEHLRLVAQSGLSPADKVALAKDVLARFGVRDFRLLAAESYHTGRILITRARPRVPGRSRA